MIRIKKIIAELKINEIDIYPNIIDLKAKLKARVILRFARKSFRQFNTKF